MNRRRQRAFSITELMIALLVSAMLVALAYPSYREQVFKGRRTDATKSLIAVAHQLERCYTTYHRYNHPACASHLDCYETADQSLVPDGATIMAPSCNRFYAITSISPAGSETLAADGESYTLYATPLGAQAGDTRCSLFRLASNGARAATNSAGSDATDTCW